MKSAGKKLLTAFGAALLLGFLFGGFLLGGCLGREEEAEGLSPRAPKEAIAHLKLADKDVPLYEYKGAKIPELQGFHSNLAVTKDAIYGISYEAGNQTYHLKKMKLKDGVIDSIEDFGLVANEPISSDGTNIYYFHKGDGIVARYDGKEAQTFSVQGVRVLRAVFGETKAYASGAFVSEIDTVKGTISEYGMKNATTVLPKDEFARLSGNGTETQEDNAFLLCADKDGFYVTTLSPHGSPEDWTQPLHMYGPDGRKLRTFECNGNIPGSAKKRLTSERSAIATKDYIVFYHNGYMRVFNKRGGKYVGDIELKLGSKNLDPTGVAVDDENHIYFIDDKTSIYRIDL